MFAKKRIIVSVSVFAALMMSNVSVDAQGFGDFLNKAKEQVERLQSPETSDSKQTPADGASIINPLARYMEIEPIGLYGVSTAEDIGYLYLVIKVVNKTEKPSATFGSSIQNQNMIAVDGSGNIHNINSSGAIRLDTPQDIPVKIELSDPDFQFCNISKSVTVMPTVRMGVNIDAQRQGVLTFKNLPVSWDEYPE